MRRFAVTLAIAFASICFGTAAHANAVRRPIRSVAGSGHGCPCPYDQIVRRDGAIYQCGGVSAWSRTGGVEPTCYTQDYATQILNGGNFLDWNDTLMSCMSNPMHYRVLY